MEPLFGDRFQDSGIALVTRNDAVKLLELFHLVDRYAQFFHLEGSRVANDVCFGFGAGMITREAVIGVDRRRQVVHLIAGWNFNFEAVGVFYRPFKFNRKLARILGLEDARSLAANYSGAE